MLRAIWQRLAERLRARDDSEHAQAIVRLVIVVVILAYLFSLSRAFVGVRPMVLVMLAEALVGIVLLGWILWRPGISHLRRWIGMLADFGTLAILMSLNPKPLAPLYVLILWVLIGNGLRYGTRYLYFATALGSTAFLAVVLGSDYWRAEPYLGYGLLVGLVAIPLYLSSLLRNLQRVTEEARRANAAKTRFLATMSHELRSPLNGIIGMAELLRTTRLSDEQREFSEVIHASAQSLHLLVDDVLDIAAIEAGKLQRKESVFSLPDVVERLELLLRPQASDKGIELETAIAADVPRRLHGDGTHLTQILMNLMHNAVKFTDRGSVTLQVSRLAESADGIVQLRYSVRDTGLGIPDQDKARIFGAFEQLDDGPTRRHGGSGLGITIASTLAQLLGGRIGLEDNAGGGSHFWLDVAMQAVSTPLLEPGQDEPLANVVAFDDPFVRHRARVRPLSILIADDQAANRTVLARIVERAGHRSVVAIDGEDVLDRLGEEDFDVAILDMHMPKLSGIDVLKQLRVMQAGLARRTPVIILSADATEQAAQDARDAGVFQFLSKPLVVARLLESVAAAVGMQSTAAALASTPVGARIRPTMLEELVQMQLGETFVRDFVEQCLRDANSSLLELERSARVAAWDAHRDAAHSLKGAAENLGAAAVAERCSLILRVSDAALARDGLRWATELQGQLLLVAEQSRAEIGHLLGSPATSDAGCEPPRHRP